MASQSLPMPTVEFWDFLQALSVKGELGGFLDEAESMLTLLKTRAANRFDPGAQAVRDTLETRARQLVERHPQIRVKWLGKRATADWTREQHGKNLEGITRSILAQVRRDAEALEREGRLDDYTWMSDPAVQRLDEERFRQHFPGAKPGNPIQVGLMVGIAAVGAVVLVACYFLCKRT